MKKSLSIITAIIFTLMCFAPFASSAEEIEEVYVKDDGKALTNDEIKILSAKCEWLKNDGMKLVIAVDDSEGVIAEDVADEYAGSMALQNGVILCINDDTKSLILKPYGSAEDIFTDEICVNIEKVAESKYHEFDVYNACKSVVVNVQNVYEGRDVADNRFYRPSVSDKEEYLTDSEYLEVSAKLDEIRETNGIDVAVIIEKYMWGDSAMEAADNYYDYYFYGNQSDDSGILLYVCKESREYWFSTYKDGERIFNEDAIEYLKEQVVPYLSDGNFYGAFMEYANTTDYILTQTDQTGRPYQKSKNVILILIGAIIIGIVVALIVAAIMTSVKQKEMNTAVKRADADEYVKNGSLMLNISRDIFLYSNVIATKKQDNDSGGSHTSSSGRSHGGGGGSF